AGLVEKCRGAPQEGGGPRGAVVRQQSTTYVTRDASTPGEARDPGDLDGVDLGGSGPGRAAVRRDVAGLVGGDAEGRGRAPERRHEGVRRVNGGRSGGPGQ